MQDEEEEDDNEEEVESGYESEQPSDNEEMMGQEQQQEIVRDIDSDMETEDNGHDRAPSDSDSVFKPDLSTQMRDVALRRAINVRRRTVGKNGQNSVDSTILDGSWSIFF